MSIVNYILPIYHSNIYFQLGRVTTLCPHTIIIDFTMLCLGTDNPWLCQNLIMKGDLFMCDINFSVFRLNISVVNSYKGDTISEPFDWTICCYLDNFFTGGLGFFITHCELSDTWRCRSNPSGTESFTTILPSIGVKLKFQVDSTIHSFRNNIMPDPLKLGLLNFQSGDLLQFFERKEPCTLILRSSHPTL